MLSVGLPKDAVKHRMAKDGVDASVLDLDPEKPHPDSVKGSEGGSNVSVPAAPPLKSDDRFAKYFKMLSVGLP
eukprot:Stramenopile-MAST_4_protein_6986